jgi:hypothetical protein
MGVLWTARIKKGLVGLKVQTKKARWLGKVRQIRHHRDRRRKPCNNGYSLLIRNNRHEVLYKLRKHLS